MSRIQKKSILQHFHEQIDKGIPITGSGAGVGISAKCAEEGGADLIIVYNSGMFRMAGRGSSCGRFAYSDANGLIFDMSNEILSSVKHTPVIAGIFGSDPYRNMERLLNQVCERGFSGIQNFPTMGNLSGIPRFYTNLCETGYGYDKEIEMVRLANKLDLLTTPYCFNENQAMRMVDTGTDIIVAHMGLTTKGMIGAALSNNLDDCVEKISKIARAAKSVNPNVLVISHGGAVSEPEDAQYIYDRVPETCGFYGASSAERIPTENALIDTVKAFKAIRIGGTL